MKPAIVIASHITGLGVIRALGIEGVPIIVAYYQESDMGYVSKYVDESIRVPHPGNGEADFITRLSECSERYPGSLIIPTDDHSVVSVSRNKNLLEQHSVVACPEWDVARNYIEKKYTYKIAEINGIPIPNTLFPQSLRDVRRWGPELKYPCILKPSQSHKYYCAFSKKLTLIEDYNELLVEYKEAADHGLEVMFQEFIPGDEKYNVNYCSYYWDDKPLVEFMAEKVGQAPPLFGVPCVLKSKNIPDIVQPGREILKALNYYGYSCVEFKRDERDGIYKLLDVNGRPNLSILHSVKSGINFPWLMYEHLINGELPTKSDFREEIYWIDMTKDIVNSLRAFKKERKIKRNILKPYFRSSVYAIFNLKDVRPIIKRFGYFIRQVLNNKTFKQLIYPQNRVRGIGDKRSGLEKTIYVEGDACNRRLLEKSKIKRYLEANGYELVSRPDAASYILLVTCAFKKKEEDRSISRLRSLMNYDSELLVYGCLPEISPQKYREFRGIKHLAPKDLDKIDTFFDGIKIGYSEIPDLNIIDYYGHTSLVKTMRDKIITNDLLSRGSYLRLKTSAVKHLKHKLVKSSKDYFLFICRGCLGKCSYCAIHRSIGSVKSKQLDNILEEFQAGIRNGYYNFHILGDDPGCYGVDIGLKFTDFLSSLLDDCRNQGNKISSLRNSAKEININIKEIHPKHLILYNDELVELFEANYVKSILCPIQSGSNRILKLMQRGHTAGEITNVILRTRKVNPRIELSTQIIVGFPSETESEFYRTLDFVKESRFDSVVVFPYQDKENTPASHLEDKIPENIVQERANKALKYFRKNRIKAYSKCPL